MGTRRRCSAWETDGAVDSTDGADEPPLGRGAAARRSRRRVWLEARSTQYPDLAQALREALLPQYAQATRLEALATLPKSESADEVNAIAASSLQCGARVGPYELIRLLGVGGMAEVWLARRADGAFTREVALKLPMLTRLRRDLERRFVRERDILARLEHPHIARFYDAGVEPNGLPYLSMEFVQGQPLTNWCDLHRLGISERLELFLQVVGAVQYAHENQVIHRDLKPSNILVTDLGQVYLSASGKLLDARRALHRALDIDSGFGQAYYDLAVAELLAHRPEQALASARGTGDSLWRLTGAALVEHSLGHPKESQQALDELIRTEASVAAYQIAEAFAWRGEKDTAFKWLERAYAQRDPGVPLWVKWDPTLALLRADSRYEALLHKMKLAE